MIVKQIVGKKMATNKLYLFVLFLTFVGLVSCNQSYKSLFKENSNNYILLKQDISNKLKKWNPKEMHNEISDFDLYINPVVLKKENIGVYNYSVVGSHHSKANFFTYNKSLKILNTADTTNTINEVKMFLNQQKFSVEEQKKCLETLRKFFSEKNDNSF